MRESKDVRILAWRRCERDYGSHLSTGLAARASSFLRTVELQDERSQRMANRILIFATSSALTPGLMDGSVSVNEKLSTTSCQWRISVVFTRRLEELLVVISSTLEETYRGPCAGGGLMAEPVTPASEIKSQMGWSVFLGVLIVALGVLSLAYPFMTGVATVL